MATEEFPGVNEGGRSEAAEEPEQQKVYLVGPRFRPPVFSGEIQEEKEDDDLRPVVIIDRKDLPPGEIVAPEGIEVVIEEPPIRANRIILRP